MTVDPLRPPETDEEPGYDHRIPNGMIRFSPYATKTQVDEFSRLWKRLGAEYVPFRLPPADPDIVGTKYHGPEDRAQRRRAGYIALACFATLALLAFGALLVPTIARLIR